jgi:hypothetical protein
MQDRADRHARERAIAVAGEDPPPVALHQPVCTENLFRVADMMESPKLAE